MKTPDQTIDSLVIGAGLTGLTTSWYLAKAGAGFLTIDRQNRPGGVIQSHSENGFLFESGPNTGIMGQPEVAELFAELGDAVKPEIANEAVKKRLILKKGRWEPLPSGMISGIRTPLFTFRDKLRLLAEPFRPPGTNPDEPLSELVKRRMGQSFLDYAIDPFILGVYSGDPAKLITRHAFPKLYQLEHQYGSFIGGSIRKSFKKKTDREMLATREVFSVSDGLEQLTNALYLGAGPERFHLGCDQVQVNPDSSGFMVSFTGPDGSTNRIHAGNVITTTGAHTLPGLFPFLNESEKETFTDIKYAPVVEVTLGFNHWDAPQPAAFGGLIPFKENRDLLGILFLSSFLENRAPAGGALLTVFMGGVRRPEWVNAPDEAIREAVQREVTDLMKLPRFDPAVFRIFRHNWAIPQYGAESDRKIQLVNSLMERYPGLIIGGNLKDGIGMADRIRQGKILAESVRQQNR